MNTIELKGRTYKVRTKPDYDASPLDNDGHGDVTEWVTRPKLPGEVVIAQDRNSYRYYDMSGAVKKAREEGWNTPPYEVLGETAGQRAVRAAKADFEYIRRWFDNQWQYVGVIVEDPDGNTDSLWGVEDDDEYVGAVAKELAEEIEFERIRELERETFPVSTMGV